MNPIALQVVVNHQLRQLQHQNKCVRRPYRFGLGGTTDGWCYFFGTPEECQEFASHASYICHEMGEDGKMKVEPYYEVKAREEPQPQSPVVTFSTSERPRVVEVSADGILSLLKTCVEDLQTSITLIEERLS